MRWDRPIRSRPVSPDEVLAGLRDLLGRDGRLPRDRVAELVRFDTDLLDLVATDALDPEAVQLYFGTGPLPVEWWEKVVEFGTVGGLCHALARFVQVPEIEPVVLLGRPCRAAGAFLLTRRLLAEAGADVSELRPSTPLLPYVWLWPQVFQWGLPRVAPGRVPEVRFLNHSLARRIVGVVLGLGGLLFGLWVARGFPVIGGLLAGIFVKVLLVDLLLTPLAARTRNWSVEFGDLYDFRDLAITLATARPDPAPAAAA